MNPVIPLLRAARFLLGWSQAEVGVAIGIKAKTVQLIEGGKYKLLPREAWILKAHYQEAGVEFVEAGSGHGAGIRWSKPGTVLEDETLDHFGTRIIRAARGLANLSQRELAKAAGVDPSFIARLEKNRYDAVNERALSSLVKGLRTKNVEMTSETTAFGAGVRWINDIRIETENTDTKEHR
ncbi:helix-turn-helix domain-containing protein [Rhizobium leguminosarum]|uniref:helix-turn-helix transcriptional regulator n=1 Tax=Rhizobium TaxID=379 RepID=UPI0010313770|nr:MULTISPECIES: helix-turn-helix transcriptional regulator [Rhizobium]NEH47488.1 helix-turn-helix domain-containing protein [Rhizobium leguminosarum]TAY79695.1 helix-turn-helix domain-containing protein [Rhizobium ruizarguesonis]TBD21806.1 helix-turn-helix domain-containing protein [Rhizobium ruizarguesonis]